MGIDLNLAHLKVYCGSRSFIELHRIWIPWLILFAWSIEMRFVIYKL